jgi:hypothetical protein
MCATALKRPNGAEDAVFQDSGHHTDPDSGSLDVLAVKAARTNRHDISHRSGHESRGRRRSSVHCRCVSLALAKATLYGLSGRARS